MARKTIQRKSAPRIFIYSFFAVIIALAFTACDDFLNINKADNGYISVRPENGTPECDLPKGDAAPDYWNITWNLNGGTVDIEEYPTHIIKNRILDEPANSPVKYYAQFIGWYMDSEFKSKFTFRNPVHYDLTLYAKWETLGVTINLPEEDSYFHYRAWEPLTYAHGTVFSAIVNDSNDQAVIWKIEAADRKELNAGTKINRGRLNVAAADHGKKVIITAVSKADDGKCGSIAITAVEWLPSDLYGDWINYSGADNSCTLNIGENYGEDWFSNNFILRGNNEDYIKFMYFKYIPTINRNNDYTNSYTTGYTIYVTFAEAVNYPDFIKNYIGFISLSEDKQTLYLGKNIFSFYNFGGDGYIPVFSKISIAL